MDSPRVRRQIPDSHLPRLVQCAQNHHRIRRPGARHSDLETKKLGISHVRVSQV
jgi:hypothetical protein